MGVGGPLDIASASTASGSVASTVLCSSSDGGIGLVPGRHIHWYGCVTPACLACTLSNKLSRGLYRLVKLRPTCFGVCQVQLHVSFERPTPAAAKADGDKSIDWDGGAVDDDDDDVDWGEAVTPQQAAAVVAATSSAPLRRNVQLRCQPYSIPLLDLLLPEAETAQSTAALDALAGDRSGGAAVEDGDGAAPQLGRPVPLDMFQRFWARCAVVC